MAEGGRSQQPVYHINVNVHTVQEGDKTRVERTETNIINPTIDLLNISQQESNRAAPGDPVGSDQGEINQGVRAMNLSSQSPVSASVKKKEVKADSVDDEQDRIIQGGNAMSMSRSEPDSTSARKKGGTPTDKGRAKSEESLSGAKENESRVFIRCEILKGRAIALCSQSKFHEASSCLDQLTSIQGGNFDFNTMLLMAECNLRLGREKKADKTIDDLKHFLLTSPSDVDDVIRFAGDLIDDKSYVRALVLLRIAGDIYANHPTLSPDDIVGGIRECVSKIDDAAMPMIESGGRLRTIAVDYSLVFMTEMVDILRAVENADPAVSAKHVASCVDYIGYNYSLAGEHEKSIEFYKTGVETMERQFHNNATKYKTYSALLNNLGFANDDLGKYNIAEQYFNKAIDAYNNATDYSDEDEKQQDIESTQNNLKIVRENMK